MHASLDHAIFACILDNLRGVILSLDDEATALMSFVRQLMNTRLTNVILTYKVQAEN